MGHVAKILAGVMFGATIIGAGSINISINIFIRLVCAWIFFYIITYKVLEKLKKN